MAYRIEYAPSGSVIKEKRKNRIRWISAAVMFLLLMGILRLTGFGDFALDILIPGDPDVTAAAWNQMVDLLRDGSSIRLAVATFCEQILEGAAIAQ